MLLLLLRPVVELCKWRPVVVGTPPTAKESGDDEAVDVVVVGCK